MPGTIHIDQAATFSGPPIALMAVVKTKFGTDQPEISKDGERKYSVHVAVTYRPEYGMAPQSEVLQVTVTGGPDLTSSLQPSSPVEFDDLRCGFSAAEARPDGRIRGGKPFFMATAVKAFAGTGNGRPVAEASKVA